MIPRLGRTLLWILPYLVSGFSAPVIFSKISDRTVAGHYAGILFILAGLWSLFLAFSHRYGMAAKSFLILVFVLETTFWTWRFFNDVPLRDAHLLVLNGDAWHHMLTALYLFAALVLAVMEFRRS